MQSLFPFPSLGYTGTMARWEPDAETRLQQAAMDLFVERGYDKTTVADIARRANLTERTFFRYFADKREVLFARSHLLQEFVSEAVESSQSEDPLESVVGAFESAAADFFDKRAEFSRRRRDIINASPELHERELNKLVRMTAGIASSLVKRGVDADRARMAAEAGMLVFRVAFDRWAGSTEGFLADYLRSALAELRSSLIPH